MRILIVAPTSDLQNVEDWVASARGHELTVLNKFVTVREVLQCIATGRPTLVQFGSHGCVDALDVSDGQIPKDLLEDALRAAGTVQLVILGACRSIGVGASLYMAGVPRVLSWRHDVDDQIAAEWARVFYQSLALTGEIWDASQTAAEAVRRRGAEPPIYLNGRQSRMEAEIQELKRALDGASHTARKPGGVPTWVLGTLTVYGVMLLALLGLVVAQ